MKILLFLATASVLSAQTMVDWNSQIRNKPRLSNATVAVFATNSGSTGRGGYIQLGPLDYPDFNCKDMFGNPVNQPKPEPGFPPFGVDDAVMWVSQSPLDGVTPPGCGPAFIMNPNLNYGLNLNTYLLAMGGLSSTIDTYNSIQSFGGGVLGNSFTAGTLYPPGTVLSTGRVLTNPEYLGGHTDTGHSDGPPANGTIHTVTNPFSRFEGLVAGQIYYDDAIGCERVYSGTTWGCIGAGSSAPGGITGSIQFNNAGTLSGSANLLYQNQTLVAIASDAQHAAIDAVTGFVQSDVGFTANPAKATTYNAVQAPGGGMQALSFSAVNYTQTGNSAGQPALTQFDQFHAGTMNYNTMAMCEQVFDGNVWGCLGGGTGAPGGVLNSVQLNSGATIGGSANLTFANQTLIAIASDAQHAAIYARTGFVQSDVGFTANPAFATTYNSFQAPAGGMQARSFSATGYIQTGNSAGVPAVTQFDQFHAGALNYNTVSLCEQVFDGANWACMTGGGGGSPGGPVNSVQLSGGTSLTGSANLTFAGQTLTVIASAASNPAIYGRTGFILSDIGFTANPSTATTYNAFQAPGGGMQAKSFSATGYVQSGSSAGIPALTQFDSFHAGTLNYDTTAACEQVFDGVQWACIAAGGGGGSPIGPVNSVQLNGGTGFLGSANLTFVSQSLLVTALSSSNAAIYAKTGFVQSDIGFTALPATATTYNAFQAPAGGMQAKSFSATAYVQTGNSAGAPAATQFDAFHAGAMNWNTTSACEQVFNGSTWTCIGSSPPGGSFQQVQFNNGGTFGGSSAFTWNGSTLSVSNLSISGTCSGCGGAAAGVSSFNGRTGAVALTSGDVSAVEQDLRTNAFPTFNGVASLTFFNCAATGTSPCVQQAGGFWSINGQGDFLGQSMTLGQNNGSTATGGRGVTISNAGNNISMFAFDNSGVCAIGSGLTAPGIVCSSDQRLKTPGLSIPTGLDAIMQLRPVTFHWKGSGSPGVGFIAQEVRDVLPNLVSEGPDPDKYLMLSEDGMIPYLVRAIQEQQAEIAALKAGPSGNALRTLARSHK